MMGPAHGGKRRAVLDTNVLISGLLWKGAPNRVLALAEAGEFAIVSSPACIEELQKALSRRKFASRISELGTSVDELVTAFLGLVELTEDPESPRIVPEDPDDDKFLALAGAVGALWVVSGDRHLLNLGKHGNIDILDPKSFIDALSASC